MNNSAPTAISTDADNLNPALTNTIRLLARLGREKFFGKVTVEFRDGKIVIIRREETIQP